MTQQAYRPRSSKAKAPMSLPAPKPVSLAVGLLCLLACHGWSRAAEASSDTGAIAPAEASAPPLRISTSLVLPVGGPDGKDLPVYFEADRMEGMAGERTKATGSVKLRRGDLTMRADEVTHTQVDNQAQALGHVRITRQGDVYTGPKLQLKLDTLEGEFTSPTYRFARTGAGGKADKVQFLGPNKLRATGATYTSCTPENTAAPDWELTTSAVAMDFDANEGRAENAVVRFKGVPILAAPVLTFPLTEARKSGFLPPNFDIDDKSGFEFALPYYWNIAPNRDATLTPTLSSRRGIGLDAETRYLYGSDRGALRVVGLPNDRVAARDRGLLDLQHQGNLNRAGSPVLTSYDIRWRRVSDDDYWKDFPRNLPSLTPRLYDSHAGIERQFSSRAWGLGPSQTSLYARVQTWQALQDLSSTTEASAQIISPYRREPQIGLRSRSNSESGWLWRFEGEFNRFTNEDKTRTQGNRLHAQAQLERPWSGAGWHFTPKLGVNAASYDLDKNTGVINNTSASGPNTSRAIPTLSLDGGLVFERPVKWFGQSLIQTLEPRVQYVYTPYKDQASLPLFDSAERDFNQYSIFSENAFTGIDRISDANLLNLGLSTRIIDPASGAETLRFGVVQKVLFSDQRITPDDGPPITQRLSDLLLLGSTSVIPNWSVDTTVQYSAQNSRVERSLLGVRYSPGPWRTINMNYRYSREGNEQIDMGWQWPLAGEAPGVGTMIRERNSLQAAPAASSSCGGTWYAVGRMSYSLRDKRLSDALVGLEYDGGCWITRVVAEQVSIGRAEASTRLMFQLELVGLSRLGSSPLRALRDNIPGYRLLREDTGLLSAPAAPTDYLNDE